MKIQKLKGLIGLFRPELPVAAAACVLLGEIVALGRIPDGGALVLGALCGFCMSATALILNDYFDLEVDRVNAPQRALPSGLVTTREVLALAALTSALGIGAGYLIGPAAFAVCILFWFVGFAYNWKLKESGLPGNVMVAASTAVTFVLGGMAVGRPWDQVVWVFASIAFFVDLAEEIAGDAMDLEGDRLRGSRSLAILFGRAAAVRVAAALFVLVVLLTYVPALTGRLGASYVVIMTLSNVNTLFFTRRLLESRTPEAGRASMRGIYLGASIAILAYIASQLL